MAIYNPPKRNMIGAGLSTVGSGAMGAAGILAASGVGTAVSVPIAAVGALASGIGTILNASNDKKAMAYDTKYQNQLNAEQNLLDAKTSNNNNRTSFGQNSIKSNISTISSYVTPQGGGTGIINQRLV